MKKDQTKSSLFLSNILKPIRQPAYALDGEPFIFFVHIISNCANNKKIVVTLIDSHKSFFPAEDLEDVKKIVKKTLSAFQPFNGEVLTIDRKYDDELEGYLIESWIHDMPNFEEKITQFQMERDFK